jgi:hypothetical protein
MAGKWAFFKQKSVFTLLGRQRMQAKVRKISELTALRFGSNRKICV